MICRKCHGYWPFTPWTLSGSVDLEGATLKTERVKAVLLWCLREQALLFINACLWLTFIHLTVHFKPCSSGRGELHLSSASVLLFGSECRYLFSLIQVPGQRDFNRIVKSNEKKGSKWPLQWEKWTIFNLIMNLIVHNSVFQIAGYNPFDSCEFNLVLWIQFSGWQPIFETLSDRIEWNTR